jgi:polyhydroxyalkanoate synthase
LEQHGQIPDRTGLYRLQDFARVGDTAVFLGESHVDFIEQQMLERGYLDSREMSKSGPTL